MFVPLALHIAQSPFSRGFQSPPSLLFLCDAQHVPEDHFTPRSAQAPAKYVGQVHARLPLADRLDLQRKNWVRAPERT